jgi:hypothetical protein
MPFPDRRGISAPDKSWKILAADDADVRVSNDLVKLLA